MMLLETLPHLVQTKEAAFDIVLISYGSKSVAATFLAKWVFKDSLETAEFFRRNWRDFRRGCKNCALKVKKGGPK